MTIEIRWNSPLKRPSDAGPNALTAPEMEEIMSRFSPEKDGQVCYIDFIRFAEPQPAVVAALDSFHNFLTMARKEQGITTVEFFEALCEGNVDSKQNLCVDSEMFISGLMKMEVGIPPDEIAAVFTHINVKGLKTVTVKEFIKFAEPSVSSSTSIITEKLRKRCQHLHRLGTPLMVPFQKADISGTGRITRLQFKECVREMGFHLVDDDFLEGGEKPAHSTVSKSKAFNVKVLNEDIDDDDEIIGGGVATKEFKEIIGERFDANSKLAGNTNAKNASLENEKKRIEFEKRVKEVTQQSNAAAVSVDFEKDDEGVENNSNAMNMVKSKTMGVKPPSGRSPRNNNAATNNNNNNNKNSAPQPYETPMRPDMAATHPGVRSVSEAIDSAALENEEDDRGLSNLNLGSSDTMNIIDVEKHLNSCCKFFKGAKVLPEGLKKALQNADDTNEGFLPRRRFASAITSCDSMAGLLPEALKSAMDTFQKTKSGSQIDYRSFLNFMSWKKPVVSNGVNLMSKMLLHASSANDEFAKFDPEGQGFVRRADFYDVLRELGYNTISSGDMDDIAVLFELGTRRGEVYYSAFVEYVTQQESALELKEVESGLRSAIKQQYSDGSSNISAVDSLRGCFAELDVEQKGVISGEQFATGLDRLGFRLSKSDLDALYIRADPRGEGVTYKDFVDFITNDESSGGVIEQQKSLADFDMALLQLKSFSVVGDCKKRLPSLESLAESFKHYDHKRVGQLPLRSFAAAVRCAGFTLTRAEIVVLAQHFGNSKGAFNASSVSVPYGEFLNWSTPDEHTPPPVLGGSVNMEALMTNLRRLAARSENGSFNKWSDTFEAVDAEASGFVDEDGSRVALKKLGCKITEAEARALSIEYGGGKKGAIRYRALLRSLFPGTGSGGAGGGGDEKVGKASVRRLQAAANRLDMDLAELTRIAREIFAELDLDGVGWMSKRGFKRGMKKLITKTKMATIGDNDMDELMVRFDTAGDGSVGWKEFVSETFAGGGSAGGDELESISRFKTMMRKCIRKGVDYRAAFESSDQGFKGSLSMNDFKSVMEELGGGMTEGEVNALAMKFRTPLIGRNGGGGGVDGSGSGARVVLYLEMLHSLMPVRPVEWDDADGWRTEEKLRSMIKNRFEFWVPGKLKKAFKFFDRPTPRGKLSVNQLSDGLKRLKAFRMSASQEKQLFNIMDMSGKGYITFADFCVFVKDANNSDVCAKVISELSKGGVSKKEIKKELNVFDSNMSGLISLGDFKGTMDKLGVTLSKSDCVRMILRFDDEESGNLEINKFNDFVKTGGVRMEVDEDELMDDDEEVGDGDEEEEGDESEDEGKSKKGKGKKDKKKKGGKVGALMKKLKMKLQHAEEKGVSGKRSFEFFDKDGSGDIDEKEFQQGCKKLMRVVLNKSETVALMDKFGGKKNGRIKYTEFLKALKLSESEDEDEDDEEEGSSDDYSDNSDEESDSESERGRKKKSKQEDVRKSTKKNKSKSDSKSKSKSKSDSKSRDRKSKDGDIAKMVRKEILRMGKSNKKKPKIKSVFEGLDRNGNGNLTEREFKKGLKNMGFEFSESQVEKLLERLDEDGDGQISWKEFERFSRPDRSESDSEENDDKNESSSEEEGMSSEEIKKVVAKGMKKLIKKGEKPKVKKTFERLDVEDGGFVSKRDFKRALSDMGFEFESDVVKGLLKKFDKKGDGKIYYLGFEKLTRVEDEGGEERETDIDDIALMVRKELKRMLAKDGEKIKKSMVKKEFERADVNGDKNLGAREFKKVITRLGFKFKTAEVDKLLDYLDEDGDGEIVYPEFENLIGNVENDDKNSDSEREGSDSERDVDDLALMVRKELKRITRGSDGPPKIRLEFQKLDRNNDGSLGKREFKKALESMGFDFKVKDVKRLLEYLDADGDGSISYNEFEDLISSGEEDGDSSDDQAVFEELIDKVTSAINRGRDVLEAFEFFDGQGNGEINESDFKEGLSGLKIRAGSDTCRAVFKKFVGRRSGKIRYREFVRTVQKKRSGSGSGKSGKKGARKGGGGFDVDENLIRKMKRNRIVKTGELEDELDDLSNSSSSVSMRDLEKFLKSNFGEELSRNEVKEFCEAVDERNTGKVRWKKIVELF